MIVHAEARCTQREVANVSWFKLHSLGTQDNEHQMIIAKIIIIEHISLRHLHFLIVILFLLLLRAHFLSVVSNQQCGVNCVLSVWLTVYEWKHIFVIELLIMEIFFLMVNIGKFLGFCLTSYERILWLFFFGKGRTMLWEMFLIINLKRNFNGKSILHLNFNLKSYSKSFPIILFSPLIFIPNIHFYSKS